MTDILVIQNSKIEGIGTLGNLLESDGFRLQTVYAKQGKIPTVKNNMEIFYKNFKTMFKL